MNQAPEFNTQFWAPAVAGVAMVAAGYQLYTWVSGGTTVPQATYTNQGGLTPNANPIILDGDGRCNLWLDPALEYTLELRLPVAQGGAQVRVWNDVVGAAAGSSVVASVNGETGAVTLDAHDIPYTTSSDATWHTGTNVEASLDQVIERADAPPAASVTIADAGNLFTGSTVEAALQELGASSALPSRTGNNGKVLALAGGVLGWELRQTCYSLSATDGATVSRTVRLGVGTWQVVLDSRAAFVNWSGDPSTSTPTQNATVAAAVGGSPTTTVTTTIDFIRSGASGHAYRVFGSDIAVGQLVVAAEADFTMTIAAMTLNGAVGYGSRFTLEKIA